jgi:hypothetical protein
MLFIVDDSYFSPFFMSFSLVKILFGGGLPFGLAILYDSYDGFF